MKNVFFCLAQKCKHQLQRDRGKDVRAKKARKKCTYHVF
jgi:hypothetical protein